MDLILWRHAHAEPLAENASHQSDTERKLTQKGQLQASKMASWLNSVLPHQCTILVSPSQRTIQTALALGRPFKIVTEIGIAGSAEQILASCHWPNSRVPVLVIGHQPNLGEVVCKLIPAIQYAAIRKGNVWWISQKGDDNNQTAFLKAIMTSELIK